MDSVIMTTPSNSMRLRSRLRSAANTICARSSKRSGSGLSNKTHHRTNGAVTARNLVNRHHQNQHQPASKHNNVNLRCAVAPSCDNDDNGNNDKLKAPVGPVNTESITREVYNAWCGRLGDVTRIPSDSVQALFNEMQLYPSKNQVVEMLQCARQCGRRNSSQFLTFGEFCVFAGELRRGGARNQHPHYQYNTNTSQVQQRPLSSNKTSLSQCEVFLGGSCNPTTWRADTAIPTLSKFGITYYNPQVSTWSPELMTAEHLAKESAAVLLFVVDSQTRCIAGMLEVAHLVAKKRCLVLVVDPFKRGQAIMGETLSIQEFEDLTEGQTTLLTLVRSQGVTVHSNLSTALHCTVNLLRGPDSTFDSAAERKLSEKLIKLREVFDSVDTNHTGELSLSEVSNAYYQLTESSLRISDLHAIMNLSQKQQQRCSGDVNDVRISFEQFCGIVAEFTTIDGCSINNRINGTDGAHRFTNPTYWKLAMLRTQQLLRIYVIRPIVQIIDWVNQPVQTQSSTNNNFNYSKPQNGYHINETSPNERFDIYLGGSCMKRTTWRQNIAIPLLKRYGITYYNPSLHENISVLNGNMNDNSSTELPLVRSASRDLLHDMDVMNESKIVLFVITNETRSITSMILAAHYIALRRNVVLCVQQLSSEDCTIGCDVITKQAIKDYNRARAYITDLAKHENVPTFESVQEAVECAVNLVQTQHHER